MIITRAFDTDLELREDQRTITGIAVPYDQQVQIGKYLESFERGAFEGPRALLAPFRGGHLFYEAGFNGTGRA